jgi:hypothetical protein
MAKGSATLLTGQSLTITPSTSTEHYIIHNIIIPFGSICEIYQTNGVSSTLIMTTSTSLLSYNLHASTTYYYTVKNIGTTSIFVSYNGVVA